MVANVQHPQYSYVFNFEKVYQVTDNQNQHCHLKILTGFWSQFSEGMDGRKLDIIVLLVHSHLCCFHFWGSSLHEGQVSNRQGIHICNRQSLSFHVLMGFSIPREPFNLRRPLALWSACLAVFSIAGAIRTWTEFLDTYSRGGVYLSTCTPTFITEDRVAGLWTYLFVLSKVLDWLFIHKLLIFVPLSQVMELFDTAFIVLRKQNLIFLHWYHHITVMWMSFFSYIDVSSSCRLFMVMNYTVHSIMYTYYTLRAMRIRVPKVFAVMTTSLQIIQMVFGLMITLTVMQYKANGLGCSVSDEQNKFSFFIYSSYFILFARSYKWL